MELFREAWAESIWPTVQPTYEEMVTKRPKKQKDGAGGGHYGDKVAANPKHKGELRNMCCNMAWTHPIANTCLQEDITVSTVATWAMDFYFDTTTVEDAAEDDDVAVSAAGELGSVAASVADEPPSQFGRLSKAERL